MAGGGEGESEPVGVYFRTAGVHWSSVPGGKGAAVAAAAVMMVALKMTSLSLICLQLCYLK